MAAEQAVKRVDVHHLTRVEGHGNIVVEIGGDGKVLACRWEVPEAPRFFEAMLSGRRYDDVHHIVSRICGICAIGHQLASLQATEDALGIRISDQTLALRKLALHAENLQSHLLHIGYLVLPDLLGVGSVLPLAETHKDDLVNLVAARRVANEFSRAICGRTTHPQRFIPGGMAKLPDAGELKELRQKLVDTRPRLARAVDLVAALADRLPSFDRPSEYVGLVSPNEYALYWGEVGSSKTQRRPVNHYAAIASEYCTPKSTAKWTRGVDGPYMVGALSRFNLNADRLLPPATTAAKKLGLAAPCTNPFMITVAQLVECVHSLEDSILIIDSLLSKGLRRETAPKLRTGPGKGVGAVEVPRGILFHAYEYDGEGRILRADCVIPTNQNHANIQKDLEHLVPTLTDRSEAEIELTTSMLVRAYDPCISCSTHCIDLNGNPERLVRFVRPGEPSS